MRNLDEDDVVILIQNTDPIRAQKVRYYEDRFLKPIYQGQTGKLPLPPKLVLRTGRSDAKMTSFIAVPKNYVTEGEENISEQDLARQNAAQDVLITQIKKTKKSFRS